jgi:hypothetical protein
MPRSSGITLRPNGSGGILLTLQMISELCLGMMKSWLLIWCLQQCCQKHFLCAVMVQTSEYKWQVANGSVVPGLYFPSICLLIYYTEAILCSEWPRRSACQSSSAPCELTMICLWQLWSGGDVDVKQHQFFLVLVIEYTVIFK